MWYILFIMLCAFAFIMTLLAIFRQQNKFWCITFTLLSIVTYFILAAAVMDIEYPVSYYDPSTGTVDMSPQVFYGKSEPYLSLFFQMLAVIMMIYGIFYVMIPTIYDVLFKKKPRGRGRGRKV